MDSFTDDDIGKTVRTPDGETVGQVATIGEGTAYVETDPGVIESVKAALGLEGDREGAVAVERGEVAEVTDDDLYLSGEGSPEDPATGGSAIDRDEGTGQRDAGTPTDPGDEGDSRETADDPGDDRHSGMDDAPPEGERTVTEERGETDPERD